MSAASPLHSAFDSFFFFFSFFNLNLYQLSTVLFLELQQMIASACCQMQSGRHLLQTFLERMSKARVSGMTGERICTCITQCLIRRLGWLVRVAPTQACELPWPTGRAVICCPRQAA